MKHNKKRNTAFLYECLVKELTKSIVKNQSQQKQKIIAIIKENFKIGSALKEELDIYRTILESEKMPKTFANKLLLEIKKDFQNLNRKQIFNKQTKLIKQINETLSPKAFANFISNYKDIASVGTYLNSNLKAKNRLLIENRLVNMMASKENKKQQMTHVDNLTYKTFIKKFNNSYGRTLRQEQKDLLMNYIVSFSDNGLGLKSFLNEEITRLKGEVSLCTNNPKILKNEAFLAKTKQVLKKLESYTKLKIDESMVKEIFYIQDLVLEVNK